jgi:hypothetical protein
LAAGQVVHDPPESVFQDQGIREEQGYPPLGEPFWRVPRVYVPPAGRAANGSMRETVLMRHHKAVRHKHE